MQRELASRKAPSSVRLWIASPPVWLGVNDTSPTELEDASLTGIDAGEKAAIQLAISLHADLLMDDRKGVSAAQKKGLVVTGTLGILDLAAQRRLVSFSEAIDRLRRTTFRLPEAVLDTLLKEYEQEGGNA